MRVETNFCSRNTKLVLETLGISKVKLVDSKDPVGDFYRVSKHMLRLYKAILKVFMKECFFVTIQAEVRTHGNPIEDHRRADSDV